LTGVWSLRPLVHEGCHVGAPADAELLRHPRLDAGGYSGNGALYERVGCVNVIDARSYVLAGGALDRLAGSAALLVRKAG
jgi:hypothetical protein